MGTVLWHWMTFGQLGYYNLWSLFCCRLGWVSWGYEVRRGFVRELCCIRDWRLIGWDIWDVAPDNLGQQFVSTPWRITYGVQYKFEACFYFRMI